MSGLPQKRMTVDEYLTWAEGRPGRYELYNGVVYAMAPERAAHAEVTHAVANVLSGKGTLELSPPGLKVSVVRLVGRSVHNS